VAAADAVTLPPPNAVKIGVFYAIMWPNGQALYEFDYASCAGITGVCDGSNAHHYTGSIEFTSAIWYVSGTTEDWASSGQGPINTGEYLGIAAFTDAGGPVSNCSPLTLDGVWKVVKRSRHLQLQNQLHRYRVSVGFERTYQHV